MHLSKKIKNFIVYGLGQSINLLTPLLVIPHLVNVCGEEGLGKIGVAFSVGLIANCILDYSSYINGIKEISIHRKDETYLSDRISAIYSYKLIIVLFLVLLALVLVALNPYFKEKVLYILSFSMVIAHFFNPNWVLQGLEDFNRIAIFNIISKVIYITLIYLLIKTYNDYVLANFFLGVSATLVYIFAFYYLKKKYSLKFNRFSFQRGIQILKDDFNICLSEFCLSIYQFFPIVIISFFLGNVAAGIFKIIEQLYSVFRTFIFMFFNFSYPTICFDVKKDKNKGIATWKKYHILNLIIIIIGCITVYTFSDFILAYFRVNTELEQTKKLLNLALFIPAILVVSQALRQLMFTLDLTRIYTRIIYIVTLLNVGLIALMVKYMGLNGAFLSTIIIEVVVISLYIYYLTRQGEINYEV